MARVNVLLSTYNGERFLAEQLETILDQRDVDVTLTVRDDGSTDATAAILERYAKDPRVKVHPGPNIGPARSFLELLRLADDSYPFFAFADQDDLWDADKLAAAVRALQDESPALYCSALEFIDARGHRGGRMRAPRIVSFENALVENIAIGCTVVINAAARRLLLSCKPEQLVMHDAWAYLVISAFGRVVYDPQPHVGYRQHGANAFGADPRRLVHFLMHFRRLLRQGSFGFHEQAAAFQRCFGDRLDERRAAILRRFVDSYATLGSRMKYAFQKDVVRQSAWHDFLVRVLIIARAC